MNDKGRRLQEENKKLKKKKASISTNKAPKIGDLVKYDGAPEKLN